MPKEIFASLKSSGIAQEEFNSLEEALTDTDVHFMIRIQKEQLESNEEYEKAVELYVPTPQLRMIVMF